MSLQRPLDALRTIAKRGSSGEFICALGTVEVHVYLQHGRLAWATDSEHPSEFTRHLQRLTQLDPDSFRDILDSCRREKRHLGETFVSWGVASWEQVRDALRHQIELAIAVLRASGPAATLFLDRTKQFAEYESSLTFEVGDLLRPSELPSNIHGPSTPKARTPTPSTVRLAPDDRPATRLLAALDGGVWAELLDGIVVADAAPIADGRGRCSTAVVERTLLDGAELVALRTPEGTLAGVALANARSLWCQLPAEATVGVAMSALTGLAAPESATTDIASSSLDQAEPWIAGSQTPATRQLHEFVTRAPELLAAVVTDPGDNAWACGAGAGITAEDALSLVQRRTPALADPAPFATKPVNPDEDVSFRFRTIVSRERTVWCFGAELGARPCRILWLLLDRGTSGGLGWAYLTSLSRQLLHLRGW